MTENAQKHQSVSDGLRHILLEGKVTTQEDIRQALEDMGHVVNQSKISRLLRKLGAAKSKDEQGQIVYRLNMEPAPPTPSDALSSLIIDAVANEVNIIVYTSPGSAQLIARILDYHKKNIGIIGTIAGDDTVFIAPQSVNCTDKTLQAVQAFLFNS